jgi:hypothetical protein
MQQKQLLGNRNQDSIGCVAGDDGQDYAFDASTWHDSHPGWGPRAARGQQAAVRIGKAAPLTNSSSQNNPVRENLPLPLERPASSINILQLICANRS